MSEEKEVPVAGCLLIIGLLLIFLLLAALNDWARHVGFYQKYPPKPLKPPTYDRPRW